MCVCVCVCVCVHACAYVCVCMSACLGLLSLSFSNNGRTLTSTTANYLLSYIRMYGKTCLVRTSKGTQNQYLRIIRGIHYQGWYTSNKQGQNEEYLLSRSMY